jgi:hypothetical protein
MINRLQEHAFEQPEFRIPDVLLIPRMPLRVDNPQTRRLLNFRDKDAVGVLVANRMLRPLGSPPKGAPLWFATSTILALANDVKWLDKATRIVREHVKAKNDRACQKTV